MFYILDSQHHKLVGMISYPNSGWGLTFTKGELLNPNFGDGNISVKLESNLEYLPDYFELDGTPIVSEKLLNIWKSLPIDNYQEFPITVELPSRQIQGHYILNIAGLISCIDKEASDLQMYEDIVIMRVLNLVLDMTQVSADIFRIHDYPLAIMISERIKQTLDEANLSGILMKPADGWNDKHRF